MPYTQITDGEEVRRAFEDLRDAFRTDAEERIKKWYECGDIPHYLHPEKDDLRGVYSYPTTERVGMLSTSDVAGDAIKLH